MDKMDKLENHIKSNRSELDLYDPPQGLWEKIERKLKVRTRYHFRWEAAAAVFLLITATAVTFFTIGHSWSRSRGNYPGNGELQSERSQLRETELYYTSIINSLYREATPLLTNHPDVKKELTEDISQLDSICADIKKDLRDNVSNQEVIEALIQNYRVRIRILEDMLATLKEDKTNSQKSNGYEM
jgi:hypothetical protein